MKHIVTSAGGTVEASGHARRRPAHRVPLPESCLNKPLLGAFTTSKPDVYGAAAQSPGAPAIRSRRITNRGTFHLGGVGLGERGEHRVNATAPGDRVSHPGSAPPQERRHTYEGIERRVLTMRSTLYVVASLVARVAATVAFAAIASAQPNRKAADSIHGAGATFPAPLIAVWQRSTRAVTIQLRPDRQRRRHCRDHGADGRLRRERRAADAGSVHGLQGLRPDSVGAVGDVRHVQPPGRQEQPATSTAACSRTSTSGRSPSGTTRACEPEQGRQPPGHDHHACLPERWKRDDVQLHGLPQHRERGVHVQRSATARASVARRASADVGSSGARRDRDATEGAIGYADIAYALRNKIKFFAVQNRSGSTRCPASAASRRPRSAT